MKIIIYTVCIIFLTNCGPSKKITSIAKSSKTIFFDKISTSRLTDVSFLFVLDTSGSMQTHHRRMADNFEAFLPFIKEYPYYNFNFAVTTMSPKRYFSISQKPLFLFDKEEIKSNCGINGTPLIQNTRMGKYFRYTPSSFTKYSFDKLLCMISVNIANVKGYDSGTEAYLESIEYLIDYEDDVFSKRFFSDSNFLIVIFVSDALGEAIESKFNNLQSSGLTVFSQAVSNYGLDLLKVLKKKKQDEQIKMYGVIPNKSGACRETISTNDLIKYPLQVHEIIEKTDGKVFSICEEDWGKNLTILSEDLKSIFLIQSISLSEIPIVDTIEVYFNDHKIENNRETGWFYDPESLTIHINKDPSLFKYIKDNKKAKNQYSIRYHPFNIDIFNGAVE